MSDVLALAGVSVVRGGKAILDDVTWEVEEGQRWVVLGPNGAGKTTLLQLAAARIHPTTGVAGVLGEVLGAVDVFELRPRIGLSSASLADRIPPRERVRDVVVTASYGVVGRWRERYDGVDEGRADELLEAMGASHLVDRRFGTLSEGERKRVQIARALMTELEMAARELGRDLLTLDTRTGDVAGPLYTSLGYATSGTIPDYCLAPEGGRLDATTIMYKRLSPKG